MSSAASVTRATRGEAPDPGGPCAARRLPRMPGRLWGAGASTSRPLSSTALTGLSSAGPSHRIVETLTALPSGSRTTGTRTTKAVAHV